MSRVIVVGGGIAGLAAAYELDKAGVRTTVVERGRLGGVVRTERVDGFLIEAGPDSFLVTKPGARELCEELSLTHRLIPARARRVYVFSRGKLHPLPDGLFLTVPTRLGPFLRSGLISPAGKLRMAMDCLIPRGPEVEDESIGAFIRRRLGREALEKLAEPIMAGIHVAPADELSLRATFPRFAEMEREHGSLIRAMLRAPVTGPTSPFVSLRGGMEELVQRLITAMPRVTFVTGREVVGLEPSWRVHVQGGVMAADAVILAIPAPAAARLWKGVPPVKYVSTATVSLAYRKSRNLEGSGFVIPRREGRGILACTWSSSKFEGRAPEDHLLVRCFVEGGGSAPEAIAREEMREILGLAGPPVFSRAYRWLQANPVYAVGHERRVREFQATLPRGLHVAGAGFRGVGIPDCVRDGRAEARRVIRELGR